MLKKMRKPRDLDKAYKKTMEQRKHMTKYIPEPEGKQLKIGQTWEDTVMNVYLSGKFSEFELGMIVMVLRKIERRHPDRHYSILLRHPEMNITQAQSLIQRLYKKSIEKNGRTKGKGMEDVRSGASEGKDA